MTDVQPCARQPWQLKHRCRHRNDTAPLVATRSACRPAEHVDRRSSTAMNRIKSYKADEVTALIHGNAGLLLVHFGSPLHSSCDFVHRELDLLAPRFESEIHFAEVEPLKDLELAQVYSIEHLPTLILFVGDEEVERIDHVMLPEELAEFLETAASFYTGAQE